MKIQDDYPSGLHPAIGGCKRLSIGIFKLPLLGAKMLRKNASQGWANEDEL